MTTDSRPTSSTTPLSIHKRILFLSLPFLLLLLALEFLFRGLGYGALPDTPQTQGPELYYWITDRELGFRNRPNGWYSYDAVDGGPAISSTDERGYRNGLGWERRLDAPPQVALIGDSMLFGVEVSDNQTIASEVYRRLGMISPVVNSGVRFYNTLQEKRMLKRVLSDFPSVRVVLYVYVDNDRTGNIVQLGVWPVQTPLLRYNGPGHPFSEIEAPQPPVPWGESFQSVVHLHRSPLKSALRHAVVLSHSAALNRLSRYPAFLSDWLTSGRAREGNYSDEIGNLAVQQMIREMKEMCARHHAEFLVARATPYSNDEALEKTLLANCQRAGVPLIPVAAHFKGNPHQYMTAWLNHNDYDYHYSPRGTATFAESIAPAIQEALLRNAANFPSSF